MRKLLALSLLLLSAPASGQVVGQNHTTYRGQAGAPAAPGSGLYRVYVDNSGVLKIVNSSGTSSSVGSPGGSTTQVQYNNAGAFAGSSNFTYSAALTPLSGAASVGITVGSHQIISPSSSALDFVVNASGRGLRVTEASVFGTNDAFFQAFPGAAGYGVYESWAGVGTVLASGNNTPVIVAPNRTTLATFRRDASPNVLVTAANAAHVPLRVAGAASQSANLFEIKNSGGTDLAYFNSSGGLRNTGVRDKDESYYALNASNNTIELVNTSTIKWASGGALFNSKDLGFERAAAKVLKLTDGSTGGGTFSTPATSPAQITADQNNYNPSGSSYFQRWSSDASRNVTGMTFTATQVDGQRHMIWNVGSQNIVLVNESASSTAANRFTTSTGADLTLAAAKCANVVYDGTNSRWRATLCN